MASFNSYKHLFTPLKVGRTVLMNRVEFAPMVCDMTNFAGEATQGYIDFVEMQAETGVALINLGATPVDRATGADFRSELDVTDEYKIASLVSMVEAAHRHGAKLSVELVHAGRGADPELIRAPYALAPSVFPIPGRFPYVKEMDQHDIEHIIGCYVDCASRLKRCGFDGALIHGAHGNLIAQFLSPLVNHRTDIYGGSFENRCRFPLQLLKTVREAVGRDFILELRISGDEMTEGGMKIEDTIEFLKLAQEHIDLAHISAGLIVDPRYQFNTMPPYFRPKASNVHLSRAVKQCPDITIPVCVVGSIVSAEMAEQIIAEGSADMVAMARALLCDPEMLNKSYRGEPEKARPCLRCWSCAGGYGTSVHCAVNPSLGRTARYRKPWPAPERKKVVVVGGGVAGSQAARTLRAKGHDVVLFEKSGSLGGLLNDVNKLPFKDDMLRHTEWLQRETMACGADIRLNTEATAELVMAENPDAIIVAVGSVPARPNIPGLNRANVLHVLDVDSGRRKPSGKVVVLGGGLSGSEAAIALAMEGCDVTIVDMIPEREFAADVHDLTRNMIYYLFDEYKIKRVAEHIVRAVSDAGVEVEGKDWQYKTLEADYVVEALGMKPNAKMRIRFFELIPDVYYVGDCDVVKNIMRANHMAYDRACNI